MQNYIQVLERLQTVEQAKATLNINFKSLLITTRATLYIGADSSLYKEIALKAISHYYPNLVLIIKAGTELDKWIISGPEHARVVKASSVLYSLIEQKGARA